MGSMLRYDDEKERFSVHGQNVSCLASKMKTIFNASLYLDYTVFNFMFDFKHYRTALFWSRAQWPPLNIYSSEVRILFNAEFADIKD